MLIIPDKISYTLRVVEKLIKFKHQGVDYNTEVDKIFKYRIDNNLMHCVDSKVECCCRIYYSSIDLKIPFCDFPIKCARLLPTNKEDGLLDELVNKVCAERKNEAKYWNFVREI